jgi:hypothetical protein
MKPKKNVSISEAILVLAQEIMTLRRFDDFSEFTSALIREEHDRRFGGVVRSGASNSINSDELLKLWRNPSSSLHDELASQVESQITQSGSYKKSKRQKK